MGSIEDKAALMITLRRELSHRVRWVAFILIVPFFARAQQLIQPWQPTQFVPKTTPVQQVRPIPAGSLRMPPSEKQKILQNSSRQNIEKVRQQMLQQVNVVKGVAGDLEQISESKLTGNGSLRQKMIEAGVDRGEIERAMREIKAAVPQMREAGKAMNKSLDKDGGAR